MLSREAYHQLHFMHRSLNLNVKQLADYFNISESSVRRWLKQERYHERLPRKVEGKLSSWHDWIKSQLQQHKYSAKQIYQMLCEAGFQGSYSTVKRYVKEVRPVQGKAFFKLDFSPGDAAQVDFGYCGSIPYGNTQRRLIVFVMVLCYSRYIYAEFIPAERIEHFLQAHYNAFRDFNGIPKRVIVDNCKCAVREHHRNQPPVYNSIYLEFANFCSFSPEACNPYSPHEKGIVENAVKYIKHNFAAGRKFNSLTTANLALRNWLDNTANVRIHGTTGSSPRTLLHNEQEFLLRLPSHQPLCAVIRPVKADSRCRVWFDTNSYSVPAKYAGQRLMLQAASEKLSIYHDGKLVTSHIRCYDRKRDIVNPDHQQELKMQRRKARRQQLRRDFLNIAPIADEFLKQLEQHELNADQQLAKLVSLSELYGKEAVATVLEDMIEYSAYRAEYAQMRLMSPIRQRTVGFLHVPRAGDSLDIELPEPNLNIYNSGDNYEQPTTA